MICEIVKFQVRAGTTREDVLNDARSVAERWRGEPDLIRKHFLFDGERETIGVYLWKNRAAAVAAHDDAWRKRLLDTHGSVPSISYFDTLMIVDNPAETVIEYEVATDVGQPVGVAP